MHKVEPGKYFKILINRNNLVKLLFHHVPIDYSPVLQNVIQHASTSWRWRLQRMSQDLRKENLKFSSTSLTPIAFVKLLQQRDQEKVPTMGGVHQDTVVQFLFRSDQQGLVQDLSSYTVLQK